MDGTLSMKDAEIRQQGIAAQDAYEESVKNLAALIFRLKTIGQRHEHIAAIIRDIQINPKDYLRSEARLLALSPGDYEGFDFDSDRDLGNAIVLARKAAVEAHILAQSLGRSV